VSIFDRILFFLTHSFVLELSVLPDNATCYDLKDPLVIVMPLETRLTIAGGGGARVADRHPATPLSIPRNGVLGRLHCVSERLGRWNRITRLPLWFASAGRENNAH
jgi:hypothetical protein